MKALKKNVPEQKQLTSVILESANQIWLAGLGAFARAQEEGTKVFDTLVEAGKEIENTGKRVAEEKVDAVAGKATETWDKLEQVFQERVAKSLNRLGVPSNDDIKALSARIETLSGAVSELIKKEKAVAKPKVAAPVKAAEPKAAAGETKPQA